MWFIPLHNVWKEVIGLFRSVQIGLAQNPTFFIVKLLDWGFSCSCCTSHLLWRPLVRYACGLLCFLLLSMLWMLHITERSGFDKSRYQGYTYFCVLHFYFSNSTLHFHCLCFYKEQLLFSLWEHITFLWYTTVISFVISCLTPFISLVNHTSSKHRSL